MFGKRRVYLSLFARGAYSLGEYRARLSSGAYHWTIVIAPKGFEKSKRGSEACDCFDVTNGVKADPDHPGIDSNPNGDWYHRHRHPIDPARSGRLLLLIMIGKVPDNVSIDSIAMALQQLPLPSRFVIGENSVWWAKRAVQRLQSMGLAEQFNVDQFEVDALARADEAMEELHKPSSSTPKRYRIENYTDRPV